MCAADGLRAAGRVGGALSAAVAEGRRALELEQVLGLRAAVAVTVTVVGAAVADAALAGGGRNGVRRRRAGGPARRRR